MPRGPAQAGAVAHQGKGQQGGTDVRKGVRVIMERRKVTPPQMEPGRRCERNPPLETPLIQNFP